MVQEEDAGPAGLKSLNYAMMVTGGGGGRAALEPLESMMNQFGSRWRSDMRYAWLTITALKMSERAYSAKVLKALFDYRHPRHRYDIWGTSAPVAELTKTGSTGIGELLKATRGEARQALVERIAREIDELVGAAASDYVTLNAAIRKIGRNSRGRFTRSEAA